MMRQQLARFIFFFVNMICARGSRLGFLSFSVPAQDVTKDTKKKERRERSLYSKEEAFSAMATVGLLKKFFD
jgi:hypothetical protein